MIVLHAGWDAGRFLVWGESPRDAAPTAARRGRKPKPSADAPSPFDAGEDRLTAALKLLPWPASLQQVKTERLTLWSPAVKNQVVASSPLVAPPPETGDVASLMPASVAAAALEPNKAVGLLTLCLDRETLAPGVLVGSTLAFWAQALRFAAALTAREQFIPGVRRTGSEWFAAWSPVLAGAEAERAARFARAMPAACRALTPTPDAAPHRPASTVLDEFLQAMVDALVRNGGEPRAVVSAAIHARRGVPGRDEMFHSLHDQWLHALTAVDGRLKGPAADLEGLARQIAAWQKSALAVSLAPFRLCFRLEEPPPDGQDITAAGTWQVRYLLQARDDPSLMIPVADAWSPDRRVGEVFRKRSFAHEYLLAALGQASSLCPPIEKTLRGTTPEGFSTDTTGACDFLSQNAWMLEQAGFGVILPSWWTPGGRPRVTVRAQVHTPPKLTDGGMSLDELVQFDWKAALGDQAISLKELETLSRLKQPLVRVRGQWVEVRPDELNAVIALWKSHKTGETTVREVLRMALGLAETAGGIEISGVDAEGWLGELLETLEGRQTLTDLPPPNGLRATLRPYQVRGYSWLTFLNQWGLGACLADDMGLGKTVQTLALLQRERELGQKKPVLLVCPTSVLGNWSREAERFTPELSVLLHHGPGRDKAATFAKHAREHALVLTSYALLHRDGGLFEKVTWAGVVLDEAQNIKNPDTKQAQAARSLKGGYRIALTGTPVENHVGDLWSIMEFLNPGFLGSQADFRRRFFIPIQLERSAGATQRLKKLTGPFVLRRMKTDKTVIPDLPDKVEMKVYCTLTKEQATLYTAVVEEAKKALKDAEGIQRKGLVLGLLTKLKQVCNHPAHFLGDNSPLPERSGKLNRLTELLDELSQAGEKALLFTQFTEMGELLKSYLQETFGREVLFLHGGVTRKNRDSLVERFQSPDGPRLFVLSLKAGGTGLNLTAAAQVIHFDRWWNPAVENQATDRAFRIGQTRNVLVHKFVCSGTLEEKIDEMIEKKKTIAGKVVGTGEGWLTEMSNEQLAELVELRREALED